MTILPETLTVCLRKSSPDTEVVRARKHEDDQHGHIAIIRQLPFLMVYGIVIGMELKIDKVGRIVVPKPLRERLGFKPDTELEAIEQPEGVLLKRVEQRPSMVKVDGLWVHQGSAEPGANWERILEDVREERIESVLKAQPK
jgi:AbrB family looped-hinge helix DNA binding protein